MKSLYTYETSLSFQLKETRLPEVKSDVGSLMDTYSHIESLLKNRISSYSYFSNTKIRHSISQERYQIELKVSKHVSFRHLFFILFSLPTQGLSPWNSLNVNEAELQAELEKFLDTLL